MTDHPLTDDQFEAIRQRLADARREADLATWPLEDYRAVKRQQHDMAVLLAEIDRLADRMAAALGTSPCSWAQLIARAGDRRIRLARAEDDLLAVRGLLSPNGGPRRVPAHIEIHERVAPAVEWLLNRVAELEQRPSRAEVLREAADEIIAAPCPEHGTRDETWIECYCAVGDELRRMAHAAEAGDR